MLVAFPLPAVAQPPQTPSPGWTREQAFEQLSLHPHDLYLQFVAAQLSDDPQAAAQLQSLIPRPLDRRQIGRQRNSQVNLYSIFSGSLAVQESLQLDAMTGTGSVGTNEPLISVTTLSGPTVKSHPWEKMLGNQTPNVSRLAQCVPEEQDVCVTPHTAGRLEAPCSDVAMNWGSPVARKTHDGKCGE